MNCCLRRLLIPQKYLANLWRTQEICSVGGGVVKQIQLRTEDRENGDLEAVTP